MNSRQIFQRYMAQTSPTPMTFEVEYAKGIYINGTDGTELMDLISGINVSLVGHCHPHIVARVQQQAAKYMHTMVYGEFVHAPTTQLTEKLCSLLPDTLDNVYWVNSGAEALEGAMKLAKRVTGRYEFVAASTAYHGSSHGPVSLMSRHTYKSAFWPFLPGVRYIDFNQEEQLDKITEKTAAVICEPVQAESGLISPQNDYLKKVKTRCEDVGCLLILDEIQTAFGRVGETFAFKKYNIIPDIVTIAKGIGGGMPIGAFVANKDHMSLLSDPPLGHITTFGGHPVTAAAALATLEVLDRERLIEQVAEKAELMRGLLQHERIRSIRQNGLWFALDIGNFDNVWKAVNLGIQEFGLFFDWFLYNDACIRIAPPLTITKQEISTAMTRLNQILDRI